ncbi:MAG: FlgD immunoglobulin-like domain containing protein [bacterium]
MRYLINLRLIIAFSMIICISILTSKTTYPQGHGNHYHNDRHHNEDWPVDSLPGMVDSTMFEGYYTENLDGHGNHMRGSGMMMGFNREIGIRFHYDEIELMRRGLSEESIQVQYLDSNFQWRVIPAATVDAEVNTIFINQNPVRTFNVLSASPATSVETPESASLPGDFELLPNFPNPFNPQTTIRYRLSQDSDISLRIYDVNGREVLQLYRGRQKAGEYSATWDGTDAKGRSVESGVYFIQLKTGSLSQVREMTLLR